MSTLDAERGLVTRRPGVPELLSKLRDGVARLEGEDSWRRYLDAAARLRRYSFANTVLILEQCPYATAVAGFATWKSLGRSVRRGERAIWIVAPLVDREDGGAELVGFRRVAVFDVSQTDGPPLCPPCAVLEGGGPSGAFAALECVAASLGYSVEQAVLPAGCFGDCTYAERRIRVARDAPGAQQVKTLAHELAHALLHERHNDRGLAELEAESVAYVVCQRLGVDSASYSFGYVATWAGGTALASAAITASGERIARAVHALLAPLELDASS